MDTKIISLIVHKDFINDQFDQFIQKNDIEINQDIINFGVLLYSQFITHTQIHQSIHTKNITDQLHSNFTEKFNNINEENIILKNDCKKFKEIIQELQNSIHSLKDDKFFEINSLIDKGKQITKDEYQTIFDIQTQNNKKLEDEIFKYNQQIQELHQKIILVNEEKNIEFDRLIDKGKQITKDEYQMIINLQTEKNKKLEDDLVNTHQQIQELNRQLIDFKNNKDMEIHSMIDKGKQITKEEYQIIFNLQNEKNKKLEDDLYNTHQQIQELNRQFILLNDNKYIEFEKNKIIIEEKYQTTFCMQNERNNKLEKDIQSMNQYIQELNQKLIDANQSHNTKNIQIVDNSINQLNTKFSNYFDKIFKGNTEKGEYGESFVNNYLSDKFSNSIIIDTHKEFAKGDFIFNLDQLQTLIEVKNVQTLKKDDIDKFYRDIKLQMQNNHINSAILISLNDSNLIQGKKNLVFEIKNNIPIIMISNVFNNPDYIKFAIIIIQYLIQNKFIYNKNDDETKEQQDNKIQYIISAINEVFQHIQLQKTYHDDELAIINKLTENFKKRENNLFNIEIIIKNVFLQYPQIIMHSIQPNTFQKEQQNDQKQIIEIQKINTHLHDIIQILKTNNITDYKSIDKKMLKNFNISDNKIKLAKIKNIQKQYQIVLQQQQTEQQKEIKDNL
jgi:hypothetical protein